MNGKDPKVPNMIQRRKSRFIRKRPVLSCSIISLVCSSSVKTYLDSNMLAPCFFRQTTIPTTMDKVNSNRKMMG